MRYRKLQSFLGDDELEEGEANQSNEKGLDLMETSKSGLLTSPSGRVNDISMEDNTETKDGLISPVKISSKTFLPQEGSSLVNLSLPMPGAKKPNSKRPAFVSVVLPKPITSGSIGIQFNESKVDSVEKESIFLFAHWRQSQKQFILSRREF
ncbi:hypothetical protein IC582_013227 [Cucumis melo]